MSESEGWGSKLSSISQFLASVAVPVALFFAAQIYSESEQQREAAITQRDQSRAWTETALDILRDRLRNPANSAN